MIMCKVAEGWLKFVDVVESHKTLIITFMGFAGCAYIYNDFNTYLRTQLVTQAQQVEILRNMDARLSNVDSRLSTLEYENRQHSKK